jgi:DHA2 family multidrug resistance protein-like MFS transporter
VFTLATDLVVSAAPPERAGVAAAMSETSSEFGAAMGIAILGSIGTAVYRAGIGGEAAAALSPEVIEASRASLGGAIAIAAQLPSEAAATVAALSRQSFTQGLQVMALIAAVTMFVTAFAFRATSRMKPGDAPVLQEL